jgi:hypothetical protein
LPLTPHQTPLLQLLPEHWVAHQVSGVQALAAFFLAANAGDVAPETAKDATAATRTSFAIDFIMEFSP